jgi:hypothetical protein
MTLKEKQLYSNRLVLDYPFHWTELKKEHVDANTSSPIESPLLTQSIIRNGLLQHYYYFQDLVQSMSRSLGCPIAIQSIAFVEAMPADLLQYESHTFQHLSLLSDNARISIVLSDAFLNSFVHYALGCVGQSVLSLSMTKREKKVAEIFTDMLLKSFDKAWGQSAGRAGFHWDSSPASGDTNNYKSCFFMATVSIDGGAPVVIGTYYDAKTVLRFAKDAAPDSINQESVALSANSMSKIAVRMKGVLGHARMNMADLMQLQVGDVVALPTHLDAPVSLEIGTTRFDAVLGKKHQSLALKLLANNFGLNASGPKGDAALAQLDDSETDRDVEGLIDYDASLNDDEADLAPSNLDTFSLENTERATDETGNASDDSFSWDDINDSMISSIDDADNDNDLESSFWLEDDADSKSS